MIKNPYISRKIIDYILIITFLLGLFLQQYLKFFIIILIITGFFIVIFGKHIFSKDELKFKILLVLGVLLFLPGNYLIEFNRDNPFSQQINGWSLFVFGLIMILFSFGRYANVDIKRRFEQSGVMLTPILIVLSVIASSILIFIGIKNSLSSFIILGCAILLGGVALGIWIRKKYKK